MEENLTLTWDVFKFAPLAFMRGRTLDKFNINMRCI